MLYTLATLVLIGSFAAMAAYGILQLLRDFKKFMNGEK